jgi:hypothetical protein
MAWARADGPTHPALHRAESDVVVVGDLTQRGIAEAPALTTLLLLALVLLPVYAGEL